ncbi:AP2/ERF family transcription factor [Cohnella kolymensis]|uniref:AP2 domain-containing protein n=1 Tax=Cohnella kolymensis TaxID=1590652 RepID=UPI0006985464|nr:AP2 domain-containing protein [Cohnella kolymensis]
MRNRRILKNNSTGVNGVYPSPNGKKFCAQINCNGRRVHLGTFDTLEEAKQEREKAEEKYWRNNTA